METLFSAVSCTSPILDPMSWMSGTVLALILSLSSVVTIPVALVLFVQLDLLPSNSWGRKRLRSFLPSPSLTPRVSTGRKYLDASVSPRQPSQPAEHGEVVEAPPPVAPVPAEVPVSDSEEESWCQDDDMSSECSPREEILYRMIMKLERRLNDQSDRVNILHNEFIQVTDHMRSALSIIGNADASSDSDDY